MSKFQIGDKVVVNDPGLLMLQKFAPRGSPPNNIGYIKEIWDYGDYLIEFPIGNDPIEKHSQVAPYPEYMLRKVL